MRPNSIRFHYPLWFGDAGNNSLGRVTTSGALTEYSIPTANTLPMGITTGPDGAIWYTEGMKIGQAVFETAVVSATPGTGKVGSEVMLCGTGFAPGEQVHLFGDSTSKNLLDTAHADESGSFAVSRPVAHAAFGPESVTGVGRARVTSPCKGTTGTWPGLI